MSAQRGASSRAAAQCSPSAQHYPAISGRVGVSKGERVGTVQMCCRCPRRMWFPPGSRSHSQCLPNRTSVAGRSRRGCGSRRRCCRTLLRGFLVVVRRCQVAPLGGETSGGRVVGVCGRRSRSWEGVRRGSAQSLQSHAWQGLISTEKDCFACSVCHWMAGVAEIRMCMYHNNTRVIRIPPCQAARETEKWHITCKPGVAGG